MRLLNFKLADPCVTIELVGLGHNWDLHNFAVFTGLRYDPATNTVVMEWSVDRGLEQNPWGSPGNSAQGCRLIFADVNFLHITARDAEIPSAEDDCLEALSKVDPRETPYRMMERWPDGTEFRLLFRFQGGRNIEIGADAVELRPIDKNA